MTVPQAPNYNSSPSMSGYLSELRSMGMPGEGYQNTDYYRSLQGQVSDTMRAHGLGNGTQAAQSGVFSSGAYGVGQRQNTEAAKMEANLRTQASAQAQQQKFQQDAQQLNSLLQRAGFEKGLLDSNFANEYKAYALEHGLSQEQAESQVQQMQMIAGLIGQMGMMAAMA